MKENLNDIFNYKTNFSLEKNETSKKDVFLSLQSHKENKSRNNKSHLSTITINFPSQNQRNKTKDSLYASKTNIILSIQIDILIVKKNLVLLSCLHIKVIAHLQ